MPEERRGVVTLGGSPITLVGPDLKEGDVVPDVKLTAEDLSEVSPLEQSRDKAARLFVIVPSLDTSVCSLETKKFSDAAREIGDRVAVYGVSADLPFAMKRWCGAEGVENVTMLSDYRARALGRAWGVLMKESDLLARAVFVIDRSDRIIYREIVPEIASEPDYGAALDAARAAAAAGA
jgi:thiol peroxidase